VLGADDDIAEVTPGLGDFCFKFRFSVVFVSLSMVAITSLKTEKTFGSSPHKLTLAPRFWTGISRDQAG
jgi:hypothetical protein